MSTCNKEPKFFPNDKTESNDSTYWFIQFSDDWADECQFEGFCFMTNAEHTEWKTTLDKVFTTCGKLNMCFGTNEFNEYKFIKALERTLKSKKINEDEYKTLVKLFGKDSNYSSNVYGVFPDIERLKDLLDDAQWEKDYYAHEEKLNNE